MSVSKGFQTQANNNSHANSFQPEATLENQKEIVNKSPANFKQASPLKRKASLLVTSSHQPANQEQTEADKRIAKYNYAMHRASLATTIEETDQIIEEPKTMDSGKKN